MTPEEQATLEDEARRVEVAEVIRPGEAGAPPPGEEKPSMSSGQLMTLFARLTTKFLCPAWEVEDEECAIWGEACGMVLDKWMPEGSPEFALIAATGLIVAPRIMSGTPMRHPPKKTDEAANADPTPAG